MELLLKNFIAIAVYLRNDITNPVNTDIVSAVIKAFEGNISNDEMCSKICEAEPLMAERLEYGQAEYALSEESRIKYDFICESLKYLYEQLNLRNYDRAYNLADLLHVFPDVMLNDKNSKKLYWKIYVLGYKKRCNDSFFDKYRNMFC